MGNYQSNEINQTVDIVNRVIFSSTQASINKSSQQCSTRQQVEVIVTGEVIGSINISQNLVSVCQFDSQQTGQIQANVTNDIKNNLDQALAQAAKSLQDFLATSVSIQDQNLSVKTHLENFIQQNISSIVNNKCVAQSINAQEGKLVIAGIIRGDVNVNQDAQTSAVSSCILQALSDVVAQNSAFNEAVIKLDQKLSSEQKGATAILIVLIIAMMIVALFGGKAVDIATNPKKLIPAIIGIFILYLVLAFFFKWWPFKKKKKEGYCTRNKRRLSFQRTF